MGKFLKKAGMLFFVFFVGIVFTKGGCVKAQAASVEYRAHVQDEGWHNSVRDGATAGTVGKSYAMEAVKIKLQGVAGGISYQSHLKNVGWTSWAENDAQSGTTGQGRPMEAVRIKLTGTAAKVYDVYYRAHVGDYGWLGWTKNGEIAGSVGCSMRMEAIQIKLCTKNSKIATSRSYLTRPALTVQSHVGNVGWQGAVSEGAVSGTVSRSLRVEAMITRCNDFDGRNGIQYRSHVQDVGWQGWCNSGGTSGTTGRSLQIEAVQIKLAGNIVNVYDVYYRVHVGDVGWLGWAKNGATAGTTGGSRRMEAIQVKLVRKGDSFAAGGAAYMDLTNSSSNSVNWDSSVGKTVANIGSRYYTTDNLSYVAGYKGQCTWYAYGRFYEVTGIKLGKARHAKYWLSDNISNTRVTVAYGAANIKPKSIAVRTTGNYGHVMFVENVTYYNGSPQYVYFTECNTDGNGIYNAGSDCIVKKLSYSRFISQKNPAGYISAR